MTRTTTHPSADRLTDFLNGRLGRELHAEVEAHVADCASCLVVMSRLPDGTLARLAREAVQRVSVSEPTPLPGRFKAE
jgi:uncharacterized protein YqkB